MEEGSLQYTLRWSTQVEAIVHINLIRMHEHSNWVQVIAVTQRPTGREVLSPPPHSHRHIITIAFCQQKKETIFLKSLAKADLKCAISYNEPIFLGNYKQKFCILFSFQELGKNKIIYVCLQYNKLIILPCWLYIWVNKRQITRQVLTSFIVLWTCLVKDRPRISSGFVYVTKCNGA